MAARGIFRRVLAVILAAGTSTRLRPLTDHTPKALIQVLGRSMLERSIENLHAVGVRDIVIVTGYLGDRIDEMVARRYPNEPIHLVRNPDYATKGNGNSLLTTRHLAEGEELLLLDGDVIYQPGVLRALIASAHPDVIALHRSRALGPENEEMKLSVDADGWVVKISKEIPPGEAAGESIGIERFGAATTARLFDTLDARINRGRGSVMDHYEHAFQQMADEGVKLGVVDIDQWYVEDIDDPADLERVQAEMRSLGIS